MSFWNRLFFKKRYRISGPFRLISGKVDSPLRRRRDRLGPGGNAASRTEERARIRRPRLNPPTWIGSRLRMTCDLAGRYGAHAPGVIEMRKRVFDQFRRADASDSGRMVHESGDDSHTLAPGPRAVTKLRRAT